MDPRVVLAAAALLVTALAGCAESGGGPIKIVSQPADPSTEPVVLEAGVPGDSYEWDMGDGRPKLTGQRVEHVYGVKEGAFTVKLTATEGAQKATHSLRLEFGTGQNQAPQYELAVEWQWVQVGEEVTLSGAGSTDPEGDPLLFSWFCQPQGPIAVAGAGHGHAGGGGVPYGSSSVNVIPLRLLNGTDVPAADHTVSDHMCDNLPVGFQEGPSIRGAFTAPGLYEITMLAKDPAHPAVPGSVLMFVSETPRQAPIESLSFEGTIDLGAPGDLDGALEAAGQASHIQAHTFRLQYPTLGVQFALAHDDGSGVPAAMEYRILKGASARVEWTAEDSAKGAGDLTPDDYTAQVALRTGAGVAYTLTVDVVYVTDPAVIFEGPH